MENGEILVRPSLVFRIFCFHPSLVDFVLSNELFVWFYFILAKILVVDQGNERWKSDM